MAYSLEAFSADIKSVLVNDPGVEGQRKIREFVSKALKDNDFVETHLTSENCKPRKVLYEDPDLGFCICGHVYEEASKRIWPHDHGPAWAIYGLARGGTVMTDWEVVEKGNDTSPTLVKPSRNYDLALGECHHYETGDIHSPKWIAGTRLIRIEGKNLDNVQRSNIKAA